MEERLSIMKETLFASAEDFRRSLAIDLSALDPAVSDAVMSGRAQKFECVVELSWKTLKVFLYSVHGFDLASPKPVIKKWFELGIIDYSLCEAMLRAIDIRNSLSHVYRKDAFLPLHDEILGYGPIFSNLIRSLES